MNILILSTTYYPFIGGIEQVVHNLSLNLQQLGHQVVIVSERKPLRLPAHEIIEGLPIYRFPFTAAGLSIKGSLSYPFMFHWVVQQIRRLVEKYSIDLIHLQGVSRNAAYAIGVGQRTNTPLIATFQGVEVHSVVRGSIPQRLLRWQRYWIERILTTAVTVTTCSHALAQDLLHIAPSAAKKITVIHNGVDLAPFLHQPVGERRHLFLIGRMVYRKGLDIALRAFAIIKQSMPSAPLLVIAGDGPERANLRALAHSLNLHDQVRWLGAISDRDEIAHLFATSQVAIIPSREEPFGIVCLEALASGCPVVASQVGGIPEIVRNGIDGILVSPEDPQAMATAIMRILNREVNLAPPNVLQERAAQFSWDQIGQSYLDLYRQVISL